MYFLLVLARPWYHVVWDFKPLGPKGCSCGADFVAKVGPLLHVFTDDLATWKSIHTWHHEQDLRMVLASQLKHRVSWRASCINCPSINVPYNHRGRIRKGRETASPYRVSAETLYPKHEHPPKCGSEGVPRLGSCVGLGLLKPRPGRQKRKLKKFRGWGLNGIWRLCQFRV